MLIKKSAYDELLTNSWEHTKKLKMEIMCLKDRLRHAGALSKFDLAQEAIMRYAHPDMYEKAMEWLEDQKNKGAF